MSQRKAHRGAQGDMPWTRWKVQVSSNWGGDVVGELGKSRCFDSVKVVIADSDKSFITLVS